MDYFLYSVDLPFSQKKIFYREINSREQFLLAKFASLHPYGKENDIDFFIALNKIILNCVENKKDLLELNIVEYILFLLKIRILSFDNFLELELNPNSEKEMKEKISIDLNTFMKKFYEASSKLMENNIIEYNGIYVNLSWPDTKIAISFLENENIDISTTFVEYIKYLKTKEKTIVLNNFTKEEKNKIYENLPSKLQVLIFDKIVKSIENLFTENLFSIKSLNWLNFNFYNNIYLYFIKLLFSSDIKGLYQQYYVFASKNINLFFIDNMTTADRKVFMSLIEKELDNKEDLMNNLNSTSEGMTPLESLVDEFGG